MDEPQCVTHTARSVVTTEVRALLNVADAGFVNQKTIANSMKVA